MHSNLKRDYQLNIITYIWVVIYKSHGNHRSKIYDRYTQKKEKGTQT